MKTLSDIFCIGRGLLLTVIPAVLLSGCDPSNTTNSENAPPLMAPKILDIANKTFVQNVAIQKFSFNNTGGGKLSNCTAETLPTGLVVSVSEDESTCVISGMPRLVEPAVAYEVTAKNATGSNRASVTITVERQEPDLENLELQTYTINTPIETARFSNIGGDRLISCEAEVLPFGINLSVSSDGSTCELSGTPTHFQGEAYFPVTAVNGSGSSTASFGIKVIPPLPSLVTMDMQTLTQGEGPVTLRFENEGGGRLTSCTALNLPAGLDIDVSADGDTCEITGVPEAEHLGNVFVTVFNEAGRDDATVRIQVLPKPPVLAAVSSQVFTRGEGVSLTVGNSGGNLEGCRAESLPAGLEVRVTEDATSCEVYGVASQLQANRAHTVTAFNNGGSSSASVDIQVLAKAFVTRWVIPASNEDNSLQLVIPTEGEGYNYSVDWGDGTKDSGITGDAIHTYTLPGTYTVAIRGEFPRVLACRDSVRLSSIEQWGDIQWQSMRQAFRGCRHLVVNASDAPDLSQVTDMHGMFDMNPDIGSDVIEWDVSIEFQHSLANWDVSNVTDMSKLFHCSLSFNQDISSWDVSSVTDMSLMFYFTAFDQDITGWNVSSVSNMMGLFYGTPFNQDIGQWDVSSVKDMGFLFGENKLFNQDLSQWDVSSVEDMHGTFAYAYAFNQPLESWDVSSVESMSGMFYQAKSFNQPIGNWDVSAVTSMSQMFYDAFAFNQPIGSWDVSSVTSMYRMFWRASVFDQDISTWNITAVTDMEDMFHQVTLPVENYSALLSGWSAQNVQRDVVFDAGGSTYSSAYEGARTTLTDSFGWTITDGGVAPAP